jgi:hypothetical protein
MFTNIRKKSLDEYGASLERFLKETDNKLNIILNYFPSLPLFVMGSAYTLNKFKSITQHKMHITQLIRADGEVIIADQMEAALRPYTHNWGHVQLQHLHHTLNNAAESRMAAGIDKVVKVAHQRKAKLLVLDKDYTFPVVKAEKPVSGSIKDAPFTDAVAEVIERVLLTGGEVAFADKAVMENYKHIALIY